MVRIKLDNLLNPRHSSYVLRREASTVNVKNQDKSCEFGGGETNSQG